MQAHYYVYALRSIDRRYIYVGLTHNIEQRLLRHNNGWERTTRPYAPFSLIYSERCPDRERARAREKYLKSGIGKEYLWGLCAGGGIGRRTSLRG